MIGSRCDTAANGLDDRDCNFVFVVVDSVSRLRRDGTLDVADGRVGSARDRVR